MTLILIKFLELTITVISLVKAQTCCRKLEGKGDGREKSKSQFRWELIH